MKTAFLRYFGINKDTFRKKYQDIKKKEGENWVDFFRRAVLLKKNG